MRGLLALILFFLAAMAGRYGLEEVKKPPRAEPGRIEITAKPLVLDSSHPERTRLGDLHFLGAWELTGPDRSFGGLSSLYILPDGRVRALNDTATLFTFPQPGAAGIGPGIGEVRWLPEIRTRKGRWKPGTTDSESMAHDPRTGTVWVGFEMTQMICRYTADMAKATACRTWPEMRNWTETSSIESMARLEDGRFLVIAEGGHGAGEGRDALLFEGDPAREDTPSPIVMQYNPPAGYDPTDAVSIGNGKLLVLNRRATVYEGFTAIITLVDIGGAGPGKPLPGRDVARLTPPVLADNFEGLALERGPDGQHILWVLSDDNHLFFQRTLLLKFALPDSF